MLSGTHRVRVDEKGRLAIPAAFRRQLPEGTYLSLGQDSTLTIYPPEQWDAVQDRLRAPFLSADLRALSRMVFGHANLCEFDQQGRIGLSPEQRQLAGIEPRSTAVVVGNGQTAEIWSEARWDNYSDDALGRYTELTELVNAAP